jgi:alkylated DNA repair dioxygenase AlkB
LKFSHAEASRRAVIDRTYSQYHREYAVPRTQGDLFEIPQSLPNGMTYEPEFISPDEEEALLAEIANLPLSEAKYKQFTAKRRIMSYGASYDFSSNELIPAGPIPPFLQHLRDRVAQWVELPATSFTHALIAEYKPGTQLGWHRDVPDFEVIVGVSLSGACRMRLRPYPPRKGKNPDALSLTLESRSAYVMRGPARWGWQHSIPPTKSLRYSITFRTPSIRSK